MYSQATHSVTSLGWHFPLLVSKGTFPKLCSCSSSHRCSTSCFHVRSCLDLFPALDIGSQGSFAFHIWSVVVTRLGLRFDPDTNLLHPSTVQFGEPPSKLAAFTLRIFASLGLTELKLHPSKGTIVETTNLTILNVLLLHIGPVSEKGLVQGLMAVQVSQVVTYSAEQRSRIQAGCWKWASICT